MEKKLTKKQTDVLKFIVDFIDKKGFQPSVRDIADKFNVTPAAVMNRLLNAERKGYIKYNAPRAVEFLKEI